MLRTTSDTLKSIISQHQFQKIVPPKTKNDTVKQPQTTNINPSTDHKSSPKSKPKDDHIYESHKDTNDAWVQTMYRQLQKQIHPDKNKHVAKEATRIHNAMEKEDIVAALYSHYVYHDHCPIPNDQIDSVYETIPNDQIDSVYETIRKQYLQLRGEFDNKPPDVILKSSPDKWNDIFQQCVIKS